MRSGRSWNPPQQQRRCTNPSTVGPSERADCACAEIVRRDRFDKRAAEDAGDLEQEGGES